MEDKVVETKASEGFEPLIAKRNGDEEEGEEEEEENILNNPLINQPNKSQNKEEDKYPKNNEHEEQNEEDKENEKEFPGFDYDGYSESNYFSRLLFWWSFFILRLSKKTKWTPSHLGKLVDNNQSSNFTKNIKKYWDDHNYKTIESNGLFKTILRTNVVRLFGILFLSAVSSGSEYLIVLIIKQFIDHFEVDKEPHRYNFSLLQLGIAFLVAQIVNIYFTLHLSMKQSVFGYRAGLELSCFIYEKILKVSPSTFTSKATQGEIVNFIQVDSNKLNWMIQSSPNLFICPWIISAYIYLLFDYFGIAFFAGIGTIILCVLINYAIIKKYTVMMEDIWAKKDERMKLSTETFDSIKILKWYNWENQFKDKINEVRRKEIEAGRIILNYITGNISVFWLCPILVSISTIGVYQYLNDSFNIGTLLIGLTIFTRLQDPIMELPQIINSFIETKVSMNRIEKYLKQPNINEGNVIVGTNEEGEYAIKITNGMFTWGAKEVEEEEENGKDKSEGKGKGKDKDTVKAKNKPDKIKWNQGRNTEKNADNNAHNIENNNLIPTSERESIQDINQIITNDNIVETDKINNSSSSSSSKEINARNSNIQITIPPNIEYDIVWSDISLEIKKGELVGIIGEVGSGKSSLLQALLNSLILLNPNDCDGIHINGSICYVSQTPWIQNATIKDNILFFKPFDQNKYLQTLELSQLNHDLSNFEGRDKTEIGEKGVNLSGGQKVRVAFARAIYSDPDIYLWDDPISAWDANIGKRIMKDCIIKHLKNKTRIVVTHAWHYLKHMDKIYYIKQGKIQWVGNYSALLEQEFFESLNKLSKISKHKSSDASNENVDDLNKMSKPSSTSSWNNKKKDFKIIAEEDQEIGTVKISVYISYCIYMGGVCFIIMISFIMLFWQVTKGGSDLWWAYWSKPENQSADQDKNTKWIFFSIYSAWGITSVIFIFFRLFLLTKGTIRLGRKLHDDMLDKLIKAPINWFHDTITRGQIWNRLSKDLESIQEAMFVIGNFWIGIFTAVGSIVLCSVYDTYSLIFCPIMFILGFYWTQFYLVGSRQLSRLERVSRSPWLNTISETIPGSDSIRAFNRKEDYWRKFYSNVNDCFKIDIFIAGTNNWFTEQFDLLSMLYLIYLVTITILFEKDFTSQSVGIMFTYSIMLQKSMSFLFHSGAYMETSMVSMERCLRYTRIISEKPSVMEIDEEWRNQSWPKEGNVRFEDYSVQYRPETEIVLKNLTFNIKSKEKIGIVGRTGSGKSTICLSLFRILEPLTGTIFIDDVDISKIGLDLLRQKITIIPQDPCLMKGTLKYNIDPFDSTSDNEIIEILNKIGFDIKVKKSENEGDAEETAEGKKKTIWDKIIEQHGDNLSVGEKQLVCIARAIIRKTRIIVMDEATANIDMKTEEKIQRALMQTLGDSTIITIAHRIKTIINYDKILVLDDGRIEEFDTPGHLLRNENSMFYQWYSKSIV